ncbi:hypothetical protein H4O18_00880 [Arenibacter sp. BSSL-BM3]|uniref:YtxH domain-containing protein n=1 Tax=Arenibacter arenosicollis TaxID=2762274 RepID=A0ABR7QH63_9FLAO|nr:hypothetical protein [Arenibacter arenosicollis]MBC8766533.1 hypothetical protein [Arenibacter arenosicollis]
MKKSIFILPLLFAAAISLSGCRETKTVKDEPKGDIERAVDEAEDGVKRAGEEVKGAYKEVKEEVDGSTDDN